MLFRTKHKTVRVHKITEFNYHKIPKLIVTTDQWATIIPALALDISHVRYIVKQSSSAHPGSASCKQSHVCMRCVKIISCILRCEAFAAKI